jgi:putative (di)nucleoside polyphosphate hydrolase
MPQLHYRKGVCIVLTRQTGTQVLVCHRIGYPPDKGWQFPQGGIDSNVSLVDEARRELREEIGTDSIELVRVSKREYCYRFPQPVSKGGREYVGQCHRWVLAKLSAADTDIRFEHTPAEFDGYEWVEPAQALERIVVFKRHAYESALSELGLKVRDGHHEHNGKNIEVEGSISHKGERNPK